MSYFKQSPTNEKEATTRTYSGINLEFLSAQTTNSLNPLGTFCPQFPV